MQFNEWRYALAKVTELSLGPGSLSVWCKSVYIDESRV